MKLSSISETISRRSFLKGMGAAALGAALPGTMAAASAAVAPVVAPVAPAVIKAAAAFSFPTHTHYGRGGAPDLIDSFNGVNSTANMASRLTNGELSSATDEDFYFTGELSSDILDEIEYSAENDIEIEIDGLGNGWVAIDEGDSFTVEGPSGGYFNVYKDGLPGYYSTGPLEGSPIQDWWDSYGGYGDEPIDAAAFEIIEKEGLDLTIRDDYEMLKDEFDLENKIEPEIYKPRSDDYIYGSPMHQPFESRLRAVLERI